MLRKPDDDIEAAVTLKHPPRVLAADRDFDEVLNIAHVDPVARQGLTVQLDGEHGQSQGLFCFHICGSRHFLQDGLYPRRGLDEFIQIIAEYLDANIAADTSYRFVHALLDRLREPINGSGDN